MRKQSQQYTNIIGGVTLIWEPRSEEDLVGLSPREVEKEANKWIYHSGINERKSEYPVLKRRRIMKLKAREVLLPPEELIRLADGESIDRAYLYPAKRYW